MENNQEAPESLANDAKRLVVLLWGTYYQSHDQKNWPPEELRDILEALVRYVSGSPPDIASKDGYGSGFFKTYLALSTITCCKTLPPIAIGTVKRIPRNYKHTRRHWILRCKDSRSAYSLKLLLINAIVL
jgi:hypothetical protein